MQGGRLVALAEPDRMSTGWRAWEDVALSVAATGQCSTAAYGGQVDAARHNHKL